MPSPGPTVMKTPRSLDLAVTNRCNLRCTYCSHFDSPGDVDEDLPAKAWRRFFEECKRCGIMTVTLEGGEPFYREDLEEIVNDIVRNRMRFDILSNGTLITDETARFLFSTGRCNGVQVSLDGARPATHDAFRGKGNFHRSIRGIETLRKHDLPVSVRVTIHRENVHELDDIARFLLEDMGLAGFSTNAASFLGACRSHAQQVQLTVGEYSLAMDTLLRLNRRYQGRISAAAGPLADAVAWGGMEQARIEGWAPMPGRGRLTGCGGPLRSLAVRADGVMVPCLQMSHIELGRINRDGLRETWQHHPELRRLRERRNISMADFAFCDGCPYIGYCTGNCPALAYTLTGEDCHPSPDACLRRFLEAGGRLPEDLAGGGSE